MKLSRLAKLSLGVMLCALNLTAACVQAEEVPSAVAQEAPSLPEAVEEAVVAQPALLDQLRAGTMTAEDAWRKHGLDEKGALDLLQGNSLASSEGDDKDQELRAQLAGVLVKHAPQSLQPMEQKPPLLKRALADYYASVKDERAIALYEELAARPGTAPVIRATTLRTLGNYQRRLKKVDNAVASYLKAKTLFEKLGIKHATGEMLILAARTYSGVDDKKAQELYAQVGSVGDGWMSGLVYIDQAEHLNDRHKTVEEQQALEKGLADQKRFQPPGEIQVALLQQLGEMHYMLGKPEIARKFFNDAISLYKTASASNSNLHYTTRNAAAIAGSYLKQMEEWRKHPLSVGGLDLYLIVRRTSDPQEAAAWEKKPWAKRNVIRENRALTIRMLENDAMTVQHLSLSTYRPAPLQVTCSNPQIKLTLTDQSLPSGSAMQQANQHLKIEIPPELLPKGKTLEYAVSVSSPAFPGVEEHVALSIEAQ